jgi:hypothetical protein
MNKFINKFDSDLDLKELKRLSDISLTRKLTDEEFNKMMELKLKLDKYLDIWSGNN